jgi:molybdopterin-guanine dinucleotide biosynthesis protein A
MGEPKAWLPFGGERLLQRVVRLVATAAEPIIVVAAPDQPLPELPATVAVARDPIAGRGPLQGLSTGLAALPDSVELIFATGTDSPLLKPAWITRLVDLIGDHDLAIPFVAGFHHPLSAVYRRAATIPAIDRLLAADRLRATDLVELLHTRIVTADELREVDPDLATLRNINTPEDYQAALAAAGFGSVTR